MNSELETWLEAATRGVPGEARASARAELLAHYEDAVADYTAAGCDEAAAHRQALADLGAAAAVGRALRQTHHAERYYKLALALGIGLPLCLPLFAVTFIWADGAILVCWLLPLLVTLSAFRVLLGQQLEMETGLRPYRLARASWILLGAVIILTPFLLPGHNVFSLLAPVAADGQNLIRLMLLALLAMALGGVGVSLIWLGDTLLTYRRYCSRVEQIVAGLLLGSGFILLSGLVAATQVELALIVGLITILSIITFTTLHGLMLWLIFRAWYRKGDSPAAPA
jgi:hypothetical protein